MDSFQLLRASKIVTIMWLEQCRRWLTRVLNPVRSLKCSFAVVSDGWGARGEQIREQGTKLRQWLGAVPFLIVGSVTLPRLSLKLLSEHTSPLSAWSFSLNFLLAFVFKTLE